MSAENTPALRGFSESADFCGLFQVPVEAVEVLDKIAPASKRRALSAVKNPAAFTSDEIKLAGGDALELYRGGFINKLENEGLFALADFYTRLDVFVISEREVYESFPAKTRKSLDEWYFVKYYERLTISAEERPTADAVLTLEEALERVRKEDREACLTNCDCRSLAASINGCAAPLLTCISFRQGPNTLKDRGASTPITKEKAAAILRKADEDGLVHTAGESVICNCCADCCYLSRAKTKRDAELKKMGGDFLSWPKISKRIKADFEKCVLCGLCEERCPFRLFDCAKKQVNESGCVGCSLCVNFCPSGALSLEKLEPQPLQFNLRF
ncbi:MAG: 4Fe-4S binding protein [Spirochaetaceae bacterium]|nr:4Fe-4S binding protein [Spirochaetaceae bacterium]